ncbi:MAG TPA: hypothetical protein VK105_01680 [Virgibacillus sp.]|nr:hypothetical protein [Virgibacillus sp.]HLR65836.1 hypothetical protein [Virgibacillus sp.]
MGYILPLTLHQYKEYQKRVVQDNQNCFLVEKPYKVTLETKNHNKMKSEEYRKYKRIRRHLNDTELEKMSKKIDEKATGKGILFQEKI